MNSADSIANFIISLGKPISADHLLDGDIIAYANPAQNLFLIGIIKAKSICAFANGKVQPQFAISDEPGVELAFFKRVSGLLSEDTQRDTVGHLLANLIEGAAQARPNEVLDIGAFDYASLKGSPLWHSALLSAKAGFLALALSYEKEALTTGEWPTDDKRILLIRLAS